MAEATHTTEASLYGLGEGGGKGGALYAGLAAITDAETIDTGLDKIESVICQHIETPAPTALFTRIWPLSVAGGIITFISRTVDLTEAVDANRDFAAATDKNAYIIAAGHIGAI